MSATSAPPEADRQVIEALVAKWVPKDTQYRLLLAFGHYTDDVTEFNVELDREHGGGRRMVHVVDEHSVLGITSAWHDHLQAHPEDNDVLVVTTTVDDDRLGWDIRSYAIKGSIRSVDRAEIIKQRFGAAQLDPRIQAPENSWLVQALLEAEPTAGWPRTGSVLTRDTAIRALISARLGRGAVADGTPDAGTLLDWSREAAGPARFAALEAVERDGIAGWLSEAVGNAAVVLLRLAAEGRAAEAMPLGVVAAAITRPDASPDAALALGRHLPGTHGEELRAFTDAVHGTLQRWLSHAAAGGRGAETARERVLDVLRRADELAAQTRLTAALVDNPFLPSSFTARLHTLAATLPGDVDGAERALRALGDHSLAELEHPRYATAEAAVRLSRWLALPAPTTDTVAAGIDEQMHSGAWVDRALGTVWEGDPAGDRTAGAAYRAVCEAVRQRRDSLDGTFAEWLARWTSRASEQDTGGCLLIERVLAEVAVPLAEVGPPLIVVLDGMSAAVATEFGEQLAHTSWGEASPRPVRCAAVSALPSVTGASRTSLLTGTITSGEQDVEKNGFAAFWRQRRKNAELFHKAELAGKAGQRLSDKLLAALAEKDVVGVVLNTIDYALDHGREGASASWKLDDVSYLPELLNAARGYGRPVLLVSDHGHVLDRGDAERVAADGADAARWRTGTPGDGEVALAGPRVAYGGGSIVAPWREDIRYTPRKSGYHGGASLAEVTVPLLVALPSAGALPNGWYELRPDSAAPAWWHGGAEEPVAAESAPAPKPAKQKQPADAMPLWSDEAEPEPAPESLGMRIVATDVYAAQRKFVPRAPDKQVVAAVLDALDEADSVLALSSVATVAGRAARRPEFFATTLQRLLNVDGYEVLSTVDGGRRLKLDREMLRLQFGVKP